MALANKPPAGDHVDEVLEYAARLIEEISLGDIAGIGAKKKRAREDANLRAATIEKTRKECAAHIRAFKSRDDLTAVAVLRRIAELKGDRHEYELIDAWPLAWKGWLRIDVTICASSNSIPPPTRYTITLTDKGRDVLAGKLKPTFSDALPAT